MADDFEDAPEQWGARDMVCSGCGYEWNHVAAIQLTALQCPRCGELTDATAFPVIDELFELPAVGETFYLGWTDGRRDTGRLIEPPEEVVLFRLMLDDHREIAAIYRDGKFYMVAEHITADELDDPEPWRG